MTRKKVNQQELLAATEDLLLERGYNGFHFRILAERLKIGRSTIYDYYSSKEELILVYMNQVMEKVINDCTEWEDQAPLERLKGYLSVFLRYNQIHRMMQILPMMNHTVSSTVENEIKKLFHDHQKIYTWITEAVNEAKDQGEIRQDLPTELITAMIFTSVQLPHITKDEREISGEIVFNLLHRGFHKSYDKS